MKTTEFKIETHQKLAFSFDICFLRSLIILRVGTVVQVFLANTSNSRFHSNISIFAPKECLTFNSLLHKAIKLSII